MVNEQPPPSPDPLANTSPVQVDVRVILRKSGELQVISKASMSETVFALEAAKYALMTKGARMGASSLWSPGR